MGHSGARSRALFAGAVGRDRSDSRPRSRFHTDLRAPRLRRRLLRRADPRLERRPPLIAAAFDLAVVDKLPLGPEDQRIDAVITEDSRLLEKRNDALSRPLVLGA